MSALYTPYSLKDITLRNRIAVPPMCQYSAVDGLTNEWHQSHYASLARGGSGLVVVEATGVSPEGRITPGCTGIWNDEQAKGLAQIASSIKTAGAVPSIQIGHAGRKASANKPWEGDNHIAEDDPNSWQPIGPSSIAFGGGILPREPKEMTIEDIERVKADFVAAAQRALDAGFEWLELHYGHGYLASSFFSPHANQRTDQYGGNAENRGRFLLETLIVVREVWPANLPLSIRFGVIEFDGNDEETLSDAIELTKKFKAAGADFLSVSMGFNTPNAEIPWGPAFMAPVAERVRREADIPVGTAWGMDDAELAEKAIADGQMDLVYVGRAQLANPHWTRDTALKLGIDDPDWVLPAPYAHWLASYRPAA